MDLTLASLSSLVRLSIVDPRAAARRVLAMPVPADARWMALALVVVLSVLLTQLAIGLFATLAPPAAEAPGPTGVSPFLAGGVQAAALVLLVLAVDRVGRMFGGRGSFDGALLLVIWLHVVMICLQVIQLVTMVLVPPLGSLVALASLAAFFWVLTGFIAELHGFRSLILVFLGMLLSLFAFSVGLAILLIMLGITPPGA
jgi:hypothetical protein